MDVEKFNLQKKRLLEADRESERRRQERREETEQQKRKETWLAEIKQAGIRKAHQLQSIPGERYRLEEPPPDVLSAVARELDEHINTTTCPMPNSDLDILQRWDAEKTAENCAQKVIDEWIRRESSDGDDTSPHNGYGLNGSAYDDDDSDDDEYEDGDDWGDEDEWDEYEDYDDGDDDDW